MAAKNLIWHKCSTGEKILYLICGIFNYKILEILSTDVDEYKARKEAKKKEITDKARNILRFYKVEFRARHGFMASGTQRELIMRDHPLSDPELDEIMNTIDPAQILKTEL